MINSSTIEQKVRTILSTQLSIDEGVIKEDSLISSDLGADSLDTAEIAMMIKEEFDYDLSDEEMASIKTMGDIVAILLHKNQTK